MSSIETAYLDAHVAAYPIEYIAGIDLYNAGEFHAAHDAWEERWMGEVGPQEKLFLQAMIQSAVAFHHLDIGRPGAARQMYQRAKEKFARLNRRVFMSLDLESYQAQLDTALSWLLSAPDPRTREASRRACRGRIPRGPLRWRARHPEGRDGRLRPERRERRSGAVEGAAVKGLYSGGRRRARSSFRLSRLVGRPLPS